MLPAMNRIEVLRLLAGRYRARSYLEIGVKEGLTFFQVRVPRKIGVDPVLLIDLKARLRAARRYLPNARSLLVEEASDDFFAHRAPRLFSRRGIDLVFVDGKHTYEQALRDVRNALAHLSEQGVIVVHDTNPATPAEAWRAESWEDAQASRRPGSNQAWCGDVWKALIHLRSELPGIGVRTVHSDHGVTVINPRIRDEPIGLEPSDVPALGFEDLDRSRESWLKTCGGEAIDAWIARDPALRR
jgi:hypothetical protein